MLVLSRKRGESVFLGDEVTLTVEEICGCDGQRLFGAGVRLGFQSPRYVSICRSELRFKGSGGSGVKGRPANPTPPRPGRVVDVPDAQVRLWIQVPRKIPVCCNGTPLVALDSEAEPDGQTHASETQASTVEYRVTCNREDQVTICNNIVIATLEFHRFIARDDS